MWLLGYGNSQHPGSSQFAVSVLCVVWRLTHVKEGQWGGPTFYDVAFPSLCHNDVSVFGRSYFGFVDMCSDWSSSTPSLHPLLFTKTFLFAVTCYVVCARVGSPGFTFIIPVKRPCLAARMYHLTRPTLPPHVSFQRTCHATPRKSFSKI